MAEKEKITVVQFKEKSSDWWVNNKHYTLTKDNEILFVAGGIEIKEETEFLQAFIKRNKKQFKERSANIFESEPKQYNEKIGFGQYSDLSVSQLFAENPKYIKWMFEKFTFTSAQTKLKQEITEILKK